MIGPANPYCPARAKLAVTGGNPCLVKFEISLWPLRAVPLAFIDTHHTSALATKAVIGEIVRRVGEYHIDT